MCIIGKTQKTRKPLLQILPSRLPRRWAESSQILPQLGRDGVPGQPTPPQALAAVRLCAGPCDLAVALPPPRPTRPLTNPARARPGLWPLTAHPERVSLPSRSGTRLPAPGLGGLSRKLGGPTKVDKSEVLLQCDK